MEISRDYYWIHSIVCKLAVSWKYFGTWNLYGLLTSIYSIDDDLRPPIRRKSNLFSFSLLSSAERKSNGRKIATAIDLIFFHFFLFSFFFFIIPTIRWIFFFFFFYERARHSKRDTAFRASPVSSSFFFPFFIYFFFVYSSHFLFLSFSKCFEEWTIIIRRVGWSPLHPY